MPLKVGPFVTLFFLVKVGHYICDLNVSKLGVQVFRIYLLAKNFTILSHKQHTAAPTDVNSFILMAKFCKIPY